MVSFIMSLLPDAKRGQFFARDLCDKCCLPQPLISFCGHREILSVKNVSTLDFCL